MLITVENAASSSNHFGFSFNFIYMTLKFERRLLFPLSFNKRGNDLKGCKLYYIEQENSII